MDLCDTINSELEKKFKKKGRVVLRGDVVKDDSSSYAVFSEQGSSASHMTAAKVPDVIYRLAGCAGQASDTVSAYTQEKWKTHRNCWDYQNQSAQLSRFIYQEPTDRNHRTKFMDTPLVGLLWTQSRTGNVGSCTEKRVFLSMYTKKREKRRTT